MNPRMAWCYQGEDFMGRCRSLALASAKRVPMWEVCRKIVTRYLQAQDLAMRAPGAWMRLTKNR